MSEFFFKCQHCGANITAEDSMIGQTCSCPACENTITIRRSTNMEKQQASRVGEQKEQQNKMFNSLSTTKCAWSIAIRILGLLNLIIGGFFLSSIFWGGEGVISGISLLFSSVFMFLLSWIIQQIYLSNELKKKQIFLLEKISKDLGK